MAEFAFVPLDSDLRLQRYAQGLKNKYTQRMLPNMSTTDHIGRMQAAKAIKRDNYNKNYTGHAMAKGFETRVDMQPGYHGISPLEGTIANRRTTVGLVREEVLPDYGAPYKKLVDTSIIGHPKYNGHVLQVFADRIEKNPTTNYQVIGVNDRLNRKYADLKKRRNLPNMSVMEDY